MRLCCLGINTVPALLHLLCQCLQRRAHQRQHLLVPAACIGELPGRVQAQQSNGVLCHAQGYQALQEVPVMRLLLWR